MLSSILMTKEDGESLPADKESWDCCLSGRAGFKATPHLLLNASADDSRAYTDNSLHSTGRHRGVTRSDSNKIHPDQAWPRC